MSMDSAAAFAITLDNDAVGEGITSYDNFVEALDTAGITLDRFAQLNAEYELDNERDAQFAWEELEADDEDVTQDEFGDLAATFLTFVNDFATEHGMGLSLGFHDEDTGSVYDEVDGAFWHVDFSDVYQLTPAAEKLSEQKPLVISLFTTFG